MTTAGAHASSRSVAGSTATSLAQFLVEDHMEFDELLARAVKAPAGFDLDAWDCFRARLLRHIEIEETLLLAQPLPFARRLRVEHCALALLVSAPPSRTLVGEVRQLLLLHVGAEEGPGGALDQHAAVVDASEQARLAEAARAHPMARRLTRLVDVAAPRTAKEALREAGRRLGNA